MRCVVEVVYRLWQSGVAKAHIDSTYALEDVSTKEMIERSCGMTRRRWRKRKNSRKRRSRTSSKKERQREE